MNKQFEKLQIELDLILLKMEKDLDDLDRNSKRWSKVMYLILIAQILIATVALIALYIPHFLNHTTLSLVKIAVAWGVFNTLSQLLFQIKWNRETEREWQERRRNQKNRARIQEETELKLRRQHLQEEKLMN